MSKIFKKLIVIGAAFAFITLWLAFIKWLLPYLLETSYFGIRETTLGIFFFSCILAPLWEEAAFRHAPLQLGKAFKEKLGVDLIIPIVIISSAIFGWGHGSGPISIMIQGVGGVVLSFVYVRNNYSYLSSTFVHFLWNFSLLYVFPMFVAEYGVKI